MALFHIVRNLFLFGSEVLDEAERRRERRKTPAQRRQEAEQRAAETEKILQDEADRRDAHPEWYGPDRGQTGRKVMGIVNRLSAAAITWMVTVVVVAIMGAPALAVFLATVFAVAMFVYLSRED